ncbi:MAG: FAD-dependent oxidoreductase [Myxococcales bacterium]|nr:FAD-dependent oxidoreductase [Myxococcales bacterium]
MITSLPEQWDRCVDVVVVGSGGAALTAATLAHDGGAEVLVVEKADMIGGTTAVSGGVMWLPGNHHMSTAGVDDSREEAIAYISRLAMGHEHDPQLIEVFVDTAPEMLAYLESKTPVQMATVDNFPDYYFPFDVPGKKPAARSVEPVPYPVARELPEWRDRLASRSTLMSLGAVSTLGEEFAGSVPDMQEELARREAEDIRVKGAALIAMLAKGLFDRGVELALESPVRELVVVDGVVVGVRYEGPGDSQTVGARKGVVLACGGFEWNPELVRSFIGYDVKPLTPPNNVGDGLQMAMEAGAQLANMNSYWGQPAMFDPEIERDGELVPQFEWGRGEPGSLIVNRHAVRFANESLPYNDFPKTFGHFDPTRIEFPNEAPAWMIFDQGVKEATQILSMLPDGEPPEWMPRAASIRELAGQIDLDPDVLEATVARFDEHAAHGEDPDFRRHELGLMGPGSVRPLDQPPYYAVVVHPGTLGTNGGPRLNADAQVRGQGGGVVEGLYAAGNTAAGAFGWAYPSGGGTLGNGFVFGFRAGRHVAAQPSREIGG